MRCFQSRFRFELADSLLELSRYIVLNPVRAGMVKYAGWLRSTASSSLGSELGSRLWEAPRAGVHLGSDSLIARIEQLTAERDTKPSDIFVSQI